MEQYDIRLQIKRESRNKFIGEVGVMAFLLVIVFLVVFAGDVPNPVRISTQSNGEQLIKDYKDGLDYVKVSDKVLEYTGYYNKSNDGKIKYYCYAVDLEGKKFFVFVPRSRFKDMPKDKLENYTFTARLHKDKKLLAAVSKDYELSSSEWSQLNIISDVVLDEANTELIRTYVIWLALFMIILLCCLYGYLSFKHINDIYKRKEVKYLDKYGDIDAILDNIELEVVQSLKFDSNKIKITENYISVFTNGELFLDKRKNITKVQVVKKIKKVYGIVRIGQENFIQFFNHNHILFETPVESDVELAEIVKIMS